MRKEYNEVYEFYKRQYQGHIVLFHIGDYYYAFNEDVKIVLKADRHLKRVDYEVDLVSVKFHQNRLVDMWGKIHKITQAPITSIEYRNKSGVYDIPKVKQILQDMEDDY